MIKALIVFLAAILGLILLLFVTGLMVVLYFIVRAIIDYFRYGRGK